MRIKRGIFVIIIALVFLISTPIVSSARAGGGGGGGSRTSQVFRNTLNKFTFKPKIK